MDWRNMAKGPMTAVGYAAQAAGPVGTTILILENGHTISISESTAAALNDGRRRSGLEGIRVIDADEADALVLELKRRAEKVDGGASADGDAP